VIEEIAETPIQAITFFWGDPRDHDESVKLLQRRGIKVIWQCGSANEAHAAKQTGVDVAMAQGFEAGGHVRGTVATSALIPEVRDAVGDMPVVAAGGIADGRGLAAMLALGADGAVFGTRFLASHEAAAHPEYKRRVVNAHARKTVHTTLFDIGWPDAPHRVLRTEIVEQWEHAGRPESGKRPGEGKTVGVSRRADLAIPLVNYTVMCPTDYVDGDIAGMAFYAGQSCSLVHEVLPAGEIVRRIVNEARDVIDRLASLAR
jgi:NAD(P)H-dependent flavin oxidoreductase YrpB (nitropropane dioxygenase family)